MSGSGHITTSSKGTERSLRPIENAFCGAVAGVTCRLVISPFDVVKIRFQLQDHTLLSNCCEPPKYRHVIQSIRLIIKEEGWRSLWKGNLAAEILYLTYSAAQFFSYHEIYKRLNTMVNLFRRNQIPNFTNYV
jgi:solute carrier family 25 thiamine pyrophosphate transporter 19